MENNILEANHFDSNVLLPPRKRLLAGLKKQVSDGNPSSISCDMDVFEARVSSSMNFHMGNPNLSLEEAVEASRAAATSAHELAVSARAVAVEKEEIAARAMAAAMKALDLAASIYEDEENKERYLKKNRMKKHLPVQTLYHQNQATKKPKTDKELAINLHRVMNSSPRISKSSPGPRSNKNKRLQFNGNGLVDESTSKFDEMKVVENDDVTRSSHLNENRFENKQKKLPLSICSFRGRLNPEEDMKFGSSQCSEESREKPDLDNLPLSSPMWNFKASKGAQSVKENEVAKS